MRGVRIMAVICKRFDDLGADGAPARLGIMGGTFDPIHIGHLAIAEQAREAFRLDAVVFVPAGNPVFKKNQLVTSADLRLEMCRLAIAGNDAFDVSSMEIDRAGDTYTVDTLCALREHYPDNVELFFITGADAVRDIVRWRESERVAQLARFIAVTRPGFDLAMTRYDLADAREHFRIDYLDATLLAVSSSDLRARVASGRSIRYLTHESVRRFIADHGLYRHDPSDPSRTAQNVAERDAVPFRLHACDARVNDCEGEMRP